MNRAESPIRREQDLYFELLDFIQRPDDLRRGGGPDVGDHVDVWGPVANWICQAVSGKKDYDEESAVSGQFVAEVGDEGDGVDGLSNRS